MPQSIAIIGMQWGDEGKGKVVDLLAELARHVARAQGGNNAGHTIVAAGTEYRFHLVPSGIIYPHTKCYVGGGTALDPAAFLQELEGIRKKGISFEKRLFLSPYAHVVFPYHKLLDELSEKGQGIGTTKQGIGPCYADRVNRRGIRLADLVSPKSFEEKLLKTLQWKNFELEKLYGHPPLSGDQIYGEYSKYAAQLAPFIHPVEELLFEAARKEEKILFEGAQGSLLDVTFGTYPYVTSSCTLAGGIASGLGMGPTRIGSVLGVAKAYTTRVGQGPFPTEFSTEELARFPQHETAREIGVTTGRKRRIGWFDAVLLRHSVCLNGADSLAFTKLDILDGLKEIKICVAYKMEKKETRVFPATEEELRQAKPVYETVPGWNTSTSDIRVYDDLPHAAKAYLKRLQDLCQVPAGLVSVGPGREQTLWLDRFFDEDR